MSEPKVRYSVTLYIPQDEFEKIQEIATKEKRKMANTVGWLLRRALDELPL